MKFRKFFKDKDSLDVSLLSEKRHYMDYSGIKSDRFPAPLPVLNVLNMIGKKNLQIQLFAWILGEGLRQASLARRELAEYASAELSKAYGRPIKIPQKAIFSREAAQEIPELKAEWPGENGAGMSTQDYLEKIWVREGGEPDEIEIGNNSIPLAQINAVLLRQGKTPLFFGGPDGLMEYIEKGDWREGSSSEAYPDKSITKYGKKGIELALDPGDDGIRRLKNGKEIIALGRDPAFEKKGNNKKTITGKEEMQELDRYMRSKGLELIRNPPQPAPTQQIIFRKAGTNDPKDDIVYDVVRTTENDQTVVSWVPAAENVHSGSYVVSNASKNPDDPKQSALSGDWAEWLNHSRRESYKKIKQIFTDMKSGKEIDEKDNYIAQMLKDGSLTEEDFGTVASKLKDAMGLSTTAQPNQGSQTTMGSGPNGMPTDEEWINYKAIAKLQIMHNLATTPDPNVRNKGYGSLWGEKEGVENPIIGVSQNSIPIEGSDRSRPDPDDQVKRLDLNDPEYVGYSEDKEKREAIATKILNMVFDDDTKSVRYRIYNRRGAGKEKNEKTLSAFFSLTDSATESIFNSLEIVGKRSEKDFETFIKNGWKTDPPMDLSEIASQSKVKWINQDGSDSMDFVRDEKSGMWLQVDSAKDVSVEFEGKTYPIKSDQLYDQMTNAKRSLVKVKGHQFDDFKKGNNEPISQEEIQNYINNGFVPSTLGAHDSYLQLRNPKNDEEMLFYIRTKGDKNLYYPVSSPKQTRIENPLLISPRPTVNTGTGFTGTMAGLSSEASEKLDDWINNPEKYGTTLVPIGRGDKVPSEVKNAAYNEKLSNLTGMKGSELADKFYSDVMDILSKTTSNLHFRFGRLDHLPKHLNNALKTPCKNCNLNGEKEGSKNCETCNGAGFTPPDNGEIETLKDFIQKNVHRGQREVKEMTSSENLHSTLNSKDGPIAGINEKGEVVLRSNIYKALLFNGKGWRGQQAYSAYRSAFRNENDLKARGTGQGGQSDEDKPNDDPVDKSEPVGFGEKEKGDNRWANVKDDEDDSDIKNRETGGEDLRVITNNSPDDPNNPDDEEKKRQDDFIRKSQTRANVSQVGAAADVDKKLVGFGANQIIPPVPNTGKGVIGGVPKFRSVPQQTTSQSPKQKQAPTSTQTQTQAPTQTSTQTPAQIAAQRQQQMEQEMAKKRIARRQRKMEREMAEKRAARRARRSQNESFSSFQKWLIETGPYDSRVAKRSNRTFNVWGSPPEGKVYQKSIDGEADTADKDPTGSKGVKSGRKQKA